MLFDQFETAIKSPAVAGAIFQRAGYSVAQSDAFLNSGVLALDKDILPDELAIALLNAEPVDLFHPSFDCAAYTRLRLENDRHIILVDTFTGAAWHPAALTSAAIFGSHGDQYDLSWIGLEPIDMGRGRFGAFPYYKIETIETLQQLCDAITQREKRENFEILFRGQTREYLLTRHRDVFQFLYGQEFVREPSLPSNAFRNRFNYAKAEPFVRMMLRDVQWRRTNRKHIRHWVEDRFEECDLTLIRSEMRHALIDVMGIGQHYGIPTYGIDVTSSWETAHWFATRKFGIEGDQVFYDRHSWAGTDTEKWPVIYVLRSRNARDLLKMAYPSVRAKAQNGYFLGGSWGLHGNVAASEVICALRLAPSVGAGWQTTSELFPRPDTDGMYQELLDYKKRLLANPDAPDFGIRYIFDLRY